ncbi:MAG: carbohydrate ABC transporter permease [Oscillospiraceae bacterium]|jgi:putative aldouronate transport system permease protein|nr:carbohydrate ABC transporter permease [Oscillospiraceae bacterium]
MSTLSKYRGNKVSVFSEAVIHVVLGGFALVCVIPFIFVVIIAFTEADSLRTAGYSFFPKQLSMTSFEAAFDLGDQLKRSFYNSIFVTITGTFIGVFITVLYAYGLFRRDYPFRKFFTFIMFFTMIFSGGLVPFVIVVRNFLKIADTYWAMIIPMLVSPFHVIVMRAFYKTSIHETLIEAASIDGSGEFRTLFSIVIPLAKPGIATVALLTAIRYWNDWWFALLFIRDRTLYPLQYLLMEMHQNIEFYRRNLSMIGVSNISFDDLPSEGLRMALCVIIVLPIACAYPFFQKYIVSGLTIGALKE